MARAAFPSGRKSLLLLALAAAIIGGAWWWQRPPPEPVHDGQRLSEWLAEFEEGRSTLAARAGLQAFGRGMIPWLAYTAEYGRHPFARHGPLPFDHAPQWLRKWVPEKWGGLRAPSSNPDERRNALEALGALGQKAAPAIPALARILERESQRGNGLLVNLASAALQSTGPTSWPVVEHTFEHGNQQARCALLNTIDWRLGSLAEPASEAEVSKVVNILVKACRDPDAKVRESAAKGIRNSQTLRPALIASDTLLNELIHLLSDSDTDVRLQAVQVLGLCGTNAVQAIPRLIELLDDRTRYIRINAATTLVNVDMQEKRSAARLRIMSRDDPDAGCRDAATQCLEALALAPDEQSATPEALPGQ